MRRGLAMRTDKPAVHCQAALTLAGICSGPNHDRKTVPGRVLPIR